MRCLFQVALTDSPGIAEQLLDQVHSLASEASQVIKDPLLFCTLKNSSTNTIMIIIQTDHPYPSEELEWIATRAFNHAVDLYCSEQDDACKTWAGKAFNIAHLCNDDGALERTLQGKFLGLKWDG
jgi:hypothetical protein